MKLLVIASRNFWPITGGHEYMLCNYFEKLHNLFNIEINVVSFDKNDEKIETPSFINDVFYLKKDSTLFLIFKLPKILFTKKESLQSILFFKKKSATEFSEIIKKVNPDAIIVDLVRMSKYKAYIPNDIRTVLYAEDLFSDRYKSMYEKKQFKNALGQMSNNKVFNILSKIPFLLKWILKREYISIENEEKKAVQLFEKIIFVSDIETNKYNEKYATDKGIAITMGYDVPETNYLSYEHTNNNISIIGNFNVAANRDSLVYIIEKILPNLDVEYIFNVYGMAEDKIIEKYASSKVKFHGFVDNPSECICQSDLFLSPIAYGTGIKTKILQALSLGMPVITNDVGVNGLDEDVNNALIVSNELDDLVNHTKTLLSDSDKRKEMSVKSREYVINHHDWGKIIPVLYEVLLKNESLDD